MKTPLSFITLCLTGLLATACTPYQLADDTDEKQDDASVSTSSETGKLQLQIRGTDDSPAAAPIRVFLFDDQQCVHEHQLDNSSDTYQFQTKQGDYFLTAFAGMTDDYQLPQGLTHTSFISLPDNPISTVPLMAGHADVKLIQNAQLTVTLRPVMAALQTTLTHVPQNATEVTLSVSPVSSAYSFSGEYKNDRKTGSIPCQPSGENWTAATIYLLPASSSYTSLTVQVNTPEGQQTQSYSLPYGLEAGQPYHLKGNLNDNQMRIEGTFEIEGWKPATEIDFTFEGTTSGTPDDPNSSVSVAQLPAAGDFWNGCYVWETEDTDQASERDLLLIGPDSFSCQAAQGAEQLNGYATNGIENWRTFTRDEAKRFREQFATDSLQLAQLNEKLTTHGLAVIHTGEDDRYLCENFEYSFSMCPSKKSQIRPVGFDKVYHLRGVKLLRVRLQE